MDQLPVEILEKIIGSASLSVKDIVHLGGTCKYIESVVHNSAIWKRLFYKHYKKFAYQVASENWFHEYKFVYTIRAKAQKMLHQMPFKYFSMTDISKADYMEWQTLTNDSAYATSVVKDYLNKVIEDETLVSSCNVIPLCTPGHLTLRYYATKVGTYIRHCELTKQFEKLKALHESDKLLEKFATFLAQWGQPFTNICYERVQHTLNSIANEVYLNVQAKEPDHPLFSVPESTLKYWREKNLDKHQFSSSDCKTILNAINEVLYQKHGFFVNDIDFYNPQNSYINHVLVSKKGIPVSLSIVYESVARRLGVNCEPVNTPSHFLLRYQDDAYDSDSGNFCLDAGRGGHLYLPTACRYAPPRPFIRPRAKPLKVLLRMVRNLEEAIRESSYCRPNVSALNSILELNLLIEPRDLHAVSNLAHLCMAQNLDTTHIMDVITKTEYDDPRNAAEILARLREYSANRCYNEVIHKSLPKTRPPHIQFAVGMIIIHAMLSYTGVIIGWTPECCASTDWMDAANIGSLHRKSKQPFYYVLDEDGSNLYVAEENLVVSRFPRDLSHVEEIGRHFSHFYSNYYIPNECKQQEYPEDINVCRTYFNNLR